MNIAIDIRCLDDHPLTGVGVYTRHLLSALLKRDTTNRYFLFHSGLHRSSFPEWQLPHVREIFLHIPNKLLTASFLLTKKPRIDRWIEKQIHEPIDLFFFPNLNFFAVNCPYVITAHDLSDEIFPDFFSTRARWRYQLLHPTTTFSHAAHVVAVSRNTATDLQTRYHLPTEKISTIYPGIDQKSATAIEQYDPRVTAFKKEKNLPDRFILFLGTHEPRKNVTSVIAAFEQFKKQDHHRTHLVLVGKSGYGYDSLKKQTARSTARADIMMLPYVPDDEKPFLYYLAQAFVFPSYYEGFGFPPLEALAQGCPTIIGNNSSLSEICGNEAIQINPYDTAQLAQAMAIAVQKPRHRPTAQLEQFSWDLAADQLTHVFDRALRK
jgi:glycosyltransferase involved in cell wall biosynthesis